MNYIDNNFLQFLKSQHSNIVSVHCTKSLFNLVIIGVLPLTGMIIGTLNSVLATSIICPNAPKPGDYSLCSENYDSRLYGRKTNEKLEC